MNFRNELTESKKPTKAQMKKLGGMMRKIYKSQLGAFVSAEYKEDNKRPSIVIKYKEVNDIAYTLMFVKGFDWMDSVDLGLFRNKEATEIGQSDVILYDPNSDYGKERSSGNIYEPAVSAFVRDIMGF